MCNITKLNRPKLPTITNKEGEKGDLPWDTNILSQTEQKFTVQEDNRLASHFASGTMISIMSVKIIEIGIKLAWNQTTSSSVKLSTFIKPKGDRRLLKYGKVYASLFS